MKLVHHPVLDQKYVLRIITWFEIPISDYNNPMQETKLNTLVEWEMSGKFSRNERNILVNHNLFQKLGLIVLVILVVGISTLPSSWGGFKEAVERENKNDYTTALKEFRTLAERGHLEAQLKMGSFYERGYGVPKDDKEAVRWYRMAVEQGDSEAQLKLGWMYESGRGVPQNNKEAVRWYRMVAEKGIPKAQLIMGIMYENGRGVPKDYKEAARWYRIATENGYPAAQSHASRMVPLIIKQEWEELQEKLREERSRWLIHIKLVKEDERKRRIIHKANQGDPETQYIVGESYYFGVGVLIGEGIQVDDREAVRWYRMAAEQGHLYAQHHLGWSYAKGQGVP